MIPFMLMEFTQKIGNYIIIDITNYRSGNRNLEMGEGGEDGRGRGGGPGNC